jgi:hypothetical protein
MVGGEGAFSVWNPISSMCRDGSVKLMGFYLRKDDIGRELERIQRLRKKKRQ